MGDFGQFAETDSGVDVVAQHGLACLHVSGKETFNSFAKEFSSENGIALGPGLNRQLKVLCQSHSDTMVTYMIPSQNVG